MRLTIIPVDGLVNKDNYFFLGLDLSECNIPANVHALQWYGDEGELEFVDNPDRSKPQNEVISSLPAWAEACVVVWNTAKVEEEAELAAREAAAAEAANREIPSTTI